MNNEIEVFEKLDEKPERENQGRVLMILFIIAFLVALTSLIILLTRPHEPKIAEIEVSYPILDAIAICESGNSHTDENGQIIINVNNNKTTDIGVFQISLQTWGATATKLGYDLTKEADNRAFAKWLYFNRGTADFKFSEKCWKK